MTSGAQRALELETDGRSPYYSIAHLARGHAAYVAGDLDLAVNLLAKAAHNEAAPPIIRMLALSVPVVGRGRARPPGCSAVGWPRMPCRSSMPWGCTGTPQASLAFTALGLAQAAGGEMAAAVATIEQGLVLRRKNPAQGPWGALHHVLAASRVALAVGEHEAAKQLAEEASARMDRLPRGDGVHAGDGCG